MPFIHYCSKVWGWLDLVVCVKEVSSAHLSCIYVIKNSKNCNMKK